MIRIAAVMVRRSVATGACRASRVKQRCSMLSRVASMRSSPSMTMFASSMSASSSAVVALLMADPTEFAISTRQLLMSSSSSW